MEHISSNFQGIVPGRCSVLFRTVHISHDLSVPDISVANQCTEITTADDLGRLQAEDDNDENATATPDIVNLDTTFRIPSEFPGPQTNAKKRFALGVNAN